MSEIQIGRLLRAATHGCVMGCRVSQLDAPQFGGLVRIPLAGGDQVYGIIHDIHIDDDGLVRQLVNTPNVSEETLLDNRQNRNVPVEIGVIFVGSEKDGAVSHLLPARPPLSLDAIYACSEDELVRFTGQGRFGYLRHLYRNTELPLAELISAHLRQAGTAHAAAGDPEWVHRAAAEIITALRDEYPRLIDVLSSLKDAGIEGL